jgi:myosin III
MEASNRLEELCLEKNRKHRYLRILDEPSKGVKGARETPEENVKSYNEFIESLKILDWEEEDIIFLETVLASILVLGNVRFKDSKSGSAEIENPEEAKKVAKLLSLEEVKFLWALLNYCLIESGTAVKRKHSTDEARDARDILAGTLYKRVIDWMINLINSKLSFMRSVL